MNNDNYLRNKVREAVRTGKLPGGSPERVWGGPGSGVQCAICSESIVQSEIELEIEFVTGPRREPTSYLVHLRCFSVLDAEREALTGESGTSA